MVYRVHAREIASVPQDDDPDGTLIRFDASGRPGQRGNDGYPGMYGAHAGDDGERGGNAGPAERGQDGGTLLVELAPGSADEVVAIAGDRRLTDGTASSFRQEVSFAAPGFVDLLAPGGRGGDGGNGGRGGSGATGRRGSNATRYRSGTDGGPGGDGGDGGHATSGADGGSGGRIVVEVDQAHTHLLMLVRQNVAGGLGGQPGHNGAGGSAGAGGSGGSSYSWTETESYTDAQGNRQTRTRFRSNPGGSDGPSGMPGNPGRAGVVLGRQGRDGSFTILVGDREYPSRYEVRLSAFAHQSENTDAVYEPGERVRAFDIVVDNVGGMPTPTHSDIEVRLEQHGWIIPEEAHLLLPRGLPPGQSAELADPLWLTIGDYRPHGPDDPLRVPETVRLRADLPDVQREFVAFDDGVAEELGPFVIAFPTEASEIESLRALAPGEAARLRFTIENRSTKALGAESDSRRRVRFTLAAHHSELGDAHAMLLDDAGRRCPLDEGWTVEIDRFAPGETKAFEARIGFTRDAPLYRSLTLWLTLELGLLEQPQQLRPVQYRAFEARVASRYRHDPGADVLVLVNHRTTREELDAWRCVLEELGLKMAVWDLSLQGGLDLQAPQGDGQSLIDHFAGASMIVLNNEMTTPAGTLPARRVMGKDQIVAAARAGIDVLFVGKDVGIGHLLTPTIERAELTAEAPLVSDMVEGLEQTERRALETVVTCGAVYRWCVFRGHPGTDPVIVEAKALSERLASRYPGLRFVVVHHPAPVEVDRLWWMRKWRVGFIEVRAMLPTDAGRLLSVELPETRLHDPSAVASDEVLMAVLLTRSFREKLQLLDVALRRAAEAAAETDPPTPARDPAALVGLIADALLVDLAGELRDVLAPGWRAGLSYARLKDGMPRLAALAAFRPAGGPRLPAGSEAGQHLARLVARARRLAWAGYRIWEWLPPLPLLRRAPAAWWITRRRTAAFLRGVFAGGEPNELDARNLKEAYKYLDVAGRTLEADFESFCKREGASNRSDWQVHHAQELIFAPLARHGVTSDAEVLTGHFDRVIGARDMTEAEHRDDARWDRRDRIATSASEARASLRLTETTEELVGS